jgi:hypothetical protein
MGRLTEVEALRWVEDLVRAGEALKLVPATGEAFSVAHYESGPSKEWIAEASAALERLPVGEEVRSHWQTEITASHMGQGTSRVEGGLSVMRAVRNMMKSGRLRSLADGIRAETVSELLDQAEELNAVGHQLAATVIAGGALETHLRHLCDRAGCLPAGTGSISKYRGALDGERKARREVISATEAKLVEGWGGRRNDAAHDPSTFAATEPEVRIMVEGIRTLIARTQ